MGIWSIQLCLDALGLMLRCHYLEFLITFVESHIFILHWTVKVIQLLYKPFSYLYHMLYQCQIHISKISKKLK